MARDVTARVGAERRPGECESTVFHRPARATQNLGNNCDLIQSRPYRASWLCRPCRAGQICGAHFPGPSLVRLAPAQTVSAPWNAQNFRGEVKTHPATFAPPEAVGTNVAGNGGGRSSRCQRLVKRVSEQPGRNMNERRASLERGDANADPVDRWGRLAGRVKRAKKATRPFAGVVATAWVQQEFCDNTGNPTRREVKAPSQQAARTRLGCEGWRRGSKERRSRVTPVERRSLSSRTMTKEGKARRLA